MKKYFILLLLLALPAFVYATDSAKYYFSFGTYYNNELSPAFVQELKSKCAGSYRKYRSSERPEKKLLKSKKVNLNSFYKKKVFKKKNAILSPDSQFFIIKPHSGEIKSFFKDTSLQLMYIIDEHLGFFQIVAFKPEDINSLIFIAGHTAHREFKNFSSFSKAAQLVFVDPQFISRGSYKRAMMYSNPNEIPEFDLLHLYNSSILYVWLNVNAMFISGPKSIMFHGLYSIIHLNKTLRIVEAPRSTYNYTFGFMLPYIPNDIQMNPKPMNDMILDAMLRPFSKSLKCVGLNNKQIRNSFHHRQFEFYIENRDTTVLDSLVQSRMEIQLRMLDKILPNREVIIRHKGEVVTYTDKYVVTVEFFKDRKIYVVSYWSSADYYPAFIPLSKQFVDDIPVYEFSYNPKRDVIKVHLRSIEKCRSYSMEIIDVKE